MANRTLRTAAAVVVCLAGAACADGAPLRWKRTASAAAATPAVFAGTTYSFALSLLSYPDAPVSVRLLQATSVLAAKRLHAGDADLFLTIRPAAAGPLRIEVDRGVRYTASLTAWPAGAPVEAEPNDSHDRATPIALGSTVFGSADDIAYMPEGRTPARLDDAGADWFRFEFDGKAPKLVTFALELMERDNIPVDVAVFRRAGAGTIAYTEGEDPVTAPHEVQALPGNKFTTRLLRDPGTYYVRVLARHPEYKLRTRVYDPPPYTDPQKAVRTAVDYLLGAGDSWHANTPRRGGIFDRVSNVHQETSLCVACHATHFPLRAAVYSARNGYAPEMRQQLQFLTERFYNNPRPFYGFERDGAVWARVISAPANVLGRMSHLLDVFEKEVSGERREDFHRGVREYLKLYYTGVEKLPPDETNGNTPLVSAYEVAWYAWEVTRDPAIARLIEQDAVKNNVDLCYQTLALAAIDRAKYAGKLRHNAERILSLQRPSGQWAMRFEPDQPEAEFQTGHALWALQAAGIPVDHPQVRKAIQYLLARQQPFGGWMDPKQSYENFRTPFRESQMAVLALSAYFPKHTRAKGWNASAEANDTLSRLDAVWTGASREIAAGLASPDALVRQQAVEAAGRTAAAELLPSLVKALGDPSKLVQRTAAWAVRQVYSRRPETPVDPLVAALDSKQERVRWGATRIFATHFRALARHGELASALERRIGDPQPAVRVHALKGLWQFWYWSADDAIKDRIENAFLAQLGRTADAWTERNVSEGLYAIADENIRYYYNNWVPLLARAEDRERSIRGRLAVEERLAKKFARMLREGSDAQRTALLAALTEHPLRRSDIYDPSADLHASKPPAVYNRIGNDVEQIVFYGKSNAEFASALLPLIDSPDARLAEVARKASLLVREQRFPGVLAVAGDPGAARAQVIDAVMRRNPTPEMVKALGRAPASAKTAPEVVKARAGATQKLDRAFYEARVKPIFEAKGKDGYACVQCHATHTLFNGSYDSAHNVIDRERPENSLLLRKPTSSAETEGIANSKTTAHGGGVRWEIGSPEYNTVLDWIRGASK